MRMKVADRDRHCQYLGAKILDVKKAIYMSMCMGLFSCVEVEAIATADVTTSESNPTNQISYADFNWDYVYRYKTSSGVAVDTHWLLSAAHVADDGGSGALTINGDAYTQMQRVFHPTADLALIRYDRALPGFYPLHTGNVERFGTNPELLMVGWGYTGTVTSTSFQNGPSGQGVKRWGTNRAAQSGFPVTVDMGGEVGSLTTDVFRTAFNLNDTTYEAGGAQFDSGGGVFIRHGGQWKVAGAIILLDGTPPNFTGNFIVEIAEYADWINAVLTDQDSDGDGLPDHFETSYGAGSDLQAAADTDGDGMSNFEEWIADTDPTDATSYLRLLSDSTASLLRFTSAASREYQLQFRTNLAEGIWVETNVWAQGQSGVTEQSSPIDEPLRFNRIGVRIP
jgi:hypothetical protein